jgi:light-regulated signal transduction histidine kinase (bacteriophytochrome)
LRTFDVERLFEPFVRGNTAAEGTGLGLAIAKQAALINGGSIDAERSATGGARFVLRFQAGGAAASFTVSGRPRLGARGGMGGGDGKVDNTGGV